MKRLVAFICALVLVFSCVAVISATSGTAPTMTVESISGAPGETIEVAVELENNPGISSAVLKIDYDETRLTLISATIGEKFNAGAFTNINLPYVTFVRSNDVAENTVLLSLSFEIKGDAVKGEAYVTVLYEEGDITNYNEEDVNFEVVPGIISVECGHVAKIAVPAKSADCENNGNHLYYICDSCGLVLKADGVTETTVAAETIAALGHTWGDWIVIQKPTDAEEGIEERACTRCGYVEQRTVDRLSNPFTDVSEGRYYYDPVLWAVENGITAGITPTTFAPDSNCTRGQVVTFLWRAAGKPEPKTTVHPFTDVNEKAYYYKAMLWAVENGITAGMTATTFAPDSNCTRGQVVTFLWRAAGKREPSSTSHPFKDVNAKAYYYKAMLWAVENGITAGMTATTFAPDQTCNRGQVVTFLYRVYN